MTYIPPKNFALANYRGHRVFRIDGGYAIVNRGKIVWTTLEPAPPRSGKRTEYQKPTVPRWIIRRLAQHVEELQALA